MNIPKDWSGLTDRQVKKLLIYIYMRLWRSSVRVENHDDLYHINGDSVVITRECECEENGALAYDGPYIDERDEYVIIDELQYQLIPVYHTTGLTINGKFIPYDKKLIPWGCYSLCYNVCNRCERIAKRRDKLSRIASMFQHILPRVAR